MASTVRAAKKFGTPLPISVTVSDVSDRLAMGHGHGPSLCLSGSVLSLSRSLSWTRRSFEGRKRTSVAGAGAPFGGLLS